MLSTAENKKKLNLEELVVQSFVTSLAEDVQGKLQGGIEVPSDIEQCGGGGGGGGCYDTTWEPKPSNL